MGLAAETLERWGRTAPVEAEEPWPPFASVESGARLHLVVRWKEAVRLSWVSRWLVRLIFMLDGVNVTPQKLEFVGPASSEETARAACRDENHCSFPLVVDHFFPPEPVNLRGVRFWRRKLHKLFWLSEPEEVDELLVVRESELRRLRALESGLGRLAERVRSAL